MPFVSTSELRDAGGRGTHLFLRGLVCLTVLTVWQWAAISRADDTPAKHVSSPAESVPAAEPAVPEVIPTPQKQPLIQLDGFPGMNWVFHPGKKDTRIEETWTVLPGESGPVLVCRGEPHGYLRTTTRYQDFEFGLEWKFPHDENGNSGVLMFTTGEDKIWPTAVQVQLHQPKTGSIFGSSGAMVKPELEPKNLSRPVNQWNELLISSRGGAVRVTINGKDVGDVEVVTPQAGAIGLQSEGSEVHFRHIWIRDLQPIAQSTESGIPMSCWQPRCCPIDCGWLPFAPAYGAPPTYLGSSGWAAAGSYGQPYQYYSADSYHVANGVPLAGGSAVFYPVRGAAFARRSAGELEVVSGRRNLHSARGGRGRR